MIKRLSYTSFLIGALLMIGAVLFFLPQPSQEQTNSVQQMLTELAQETRENSPQMLDEDIRLDDATAMGENVFRYRYTFVNYAKEELDIDRLEQAMRENILIAVSESPDTKRFRDNNIQLEYAYFDKNEQFVFLITLTPEEYR